MPFQPVSLQVTDVNVFLRKKNRRKVTDFPLGVKMPRTAKDKSGNFLFLKLCVCLCVCGGGGGGANNALLVLPVCTKTCI